MGRSESEMDVRLVAPAGKEMKTCQPAAESGACLRPKSVYARQVASPLHNFWHVSTLPEFSGNGKYIRSGS